MTGMKALTRVAMQKPPPSKEYLVLLDSYKSRCDAVSGPWSADQKNKAAFSWMAVVDFWTKNPGYLMPKKRHP